MMRHAGTHTPAQRTLYKRSAPSYNDAAQALEFLPKPEDIITYGTQ